MTEVHRMMGTAPTGIAQESAARSWQSARGPVTIGTVRGARAAAGALQAGSWQLKASKMSKDRSRLPLAGRLPFSNVVRSAKAEAVGMAVWPKLHRYPFSTKPRPASACLFSYSAFLIHCPRSSSSLHTLELRPQACSPAPTQLRNALSFDG